MSDQPQYPSYPGDDGSVPGPGAAPVPPPPAQGYGQVPPAYGQLPPAYGQAPAPFGQPPASSSTKAVFSLVLGIVSMFFCYLGVLIGPAAIVLSVLATKEIGARPHGTVSGKGMATAGLVTGIIGTVVWGLVVLLTIIGLTVE